MEKNPDPESGMNIPDLISENLLMPIRIRDIVNPGSGMEQIGSGIRDKHPRSQHCCSLTLGAYFASRPPDKAISFKKISFSSFLPCSVLN
jgi:hypothetical protein